MIVPFDFAAAHRCVATFTLDKKRTNVCGQLRDNIDIDCLRDVALARYLVGSAHCRRMDDYVGLTKTKHIRYCREKISLH